MLMGHMIFQSEFRFGSRMIVSDFRTWSQDGMIELSPPTPSLYLTQYVKTSVKISYELVGTDFKFNSSPDLKRTDIPGSPLPATQSSALVVFALHGPLGYSPPVISGRLV